VATQKKRRIRRIRLFETVKELCSLTVEGHSRSIAAGDARLDRREGAPRRRKLHIPCFRVQHESKLIPLRLLSKSKHLL
jgi:hypothetical protein